MATIAHNPSFKPPTSTPLQGARPKTPPHAFIEPLSPSRVTSHRPATDYRTLDEYANAVGWSDREQQADRGQQAVRGEPRHASSHSSRHRRATSNIDTLADAALALSPSLLEQPRKSSGGNAEARNHAGLPEQRQNDAREPPHKRTRSELQTVSVLDHQPMRPATSYESGVWPHSGHDNKHNIREEDAALLLHLQSGGWPGFTSMLPPSGRPGGRPHANSFPRSFQSMRPQEPSTAFPSSLPLFAHETSAAQLPFPSPHSQFGNTLASPFEPLTTDGKGMSTVTFMPPPGANMSGGSALTPGRMEASLLTGGEYLLDADGPTRDSFEQPRRGRGWPKGKPRGPKSRKTVADKAATKRAAARKKSVGGKGGKTNKPRAELESFPAPAVRRKSWSGGDSSAGSAVHDHLSLAASRSRSVPVEIPMIIRPSPPSKPGRQKPTLRADTICAGCETTRQTTNLHGELDEWISCNGCRNWFHVDCAGFKMHEVRDVDKFFCAACETTHGKTTYVRKSSRAHASVDYAELQKGVLKTSEESPEHHYIQPIKDGTFQFDRETFPRMRPEMVTKDFFERGGVFVEPICIPAEWNPRPWEAKSRRHVEDRLVPDLSNADDVMTDVLPEDFEYDVVPDNGQDQLEMIMPKGLTVRQVCNLVGGDTPIDVIDVKTQNSGAKWNLSRWADYYEETGKEKAIRNVISLEVSLTKLGRLLQRPKVVRDIDLQDDVWPKEETQKGRFPKVQFYCLMSVADSYTDFHIDFGGSSVYYHILKGKKTFFFIPPKPKHLKAYEDWNDSPQQNFTFLPSITQECYRVDLREGDTMLIPSGWIHAVWTPEDSLVIGGNFLSRLSFRNQFKVVDIERANATPMKFRYPYFQKLMWYAAIKYLHDDPLPQEVRELFHAGKRFERTTPTWADFDGHIAAEDDRVGASHSRYYSQAELDGLPEVVNFIFRTVMLVMGRTEGVTQDRIKRVNASIPKGHGEPLELAKTFALWVAWKRGNEDPPAWAHPDAILPDNNKAPGKKFSERKLRELERKEAFAAWKVAPDRQSARVLLKSQAGSAPPADATPEREQLDVNFTSTASTHQQQMHPSTPPIHQMQTHQPLSAPSSASPAAPSMSGASAGHFTTPKTSVLGPKRVACDTCRKRRIRCKHKDVVSQSSPNGAIDISNPNSNTPQFAPELQDNINVTPAVPMAYHGHAQTNGHGVGHGVPSAMPELRPDSTQYLQAQVLMGGVSIFGGPPKQGRIKACYECRKSKVCAPMYKFLFLLVHALNFISAALHSRPGR